MFAFGATGSGHDIADGDAILTKCTLRTKEKKGEIGQQKKDMPRHADGKGRHEGEKRQRKRTKKKALRHTKQMDPNRSPRKQSSRFPGNYFTNKAN
jgi:hypothetical protein